MKDWLLIWRKSNKFGEQGFPQPIPKILKVKIHNLKQNPLGSVWNPSCYVTKE